MLMFSIPVDFFGSYMSGLNAAEDLQTKRAKNAESLLQNRFDATTFNNSLLNNQIYTALNYSNANTAVGGNAYTDLNNMYAAQQLNATAPNTIGTADLNARTANAIAKNSFNRLPTTINNMNTSQDMQQKLSQLNTYNNIVNSGNEFYRDFSRDLEVLRNSVNKAKMDGSNEVARSLIASFLAQYPNTDKNTIDALIFSSPPPTPLQQWMNQQFTNNQYNTPTIAATPNIGINTYSTPQNNTTKPPPNPFAFSNNGSSFGKGIQLPRVGSSLNNSQAYGNNSPLPKPFNPRLGQ